MDEWIHKMWCIHMVEYYSAMEKNEVLIYTIMWMNLDNTTVSESSQTQRGTYHMIPLVWNVQIGKSTDRKQIGGCQGLGKGGLRSDCLMGISFPFGGFLLGWWVFQNWEVMVAQLGECAKCHCVVHFKMGSFREFPGGSVVRTPPFHHRGHRFSPW